MSKDYYKILGVDKNASKEEIKKAYKKLAKQYHPDVSKGQEDKFKEVNEAFSVLKDDQKRKQYDQFGSEGPQGFGQGGFSGFGGSQGFDFSDLGDIFEGVFGGGFGGRRRGKPNYQGSDLRFDMEISLKEAAFGKETTITIPKLDECKDCKGTGSESGKSSVCDMCHGEGVVIKQKRSPFGMMQVQQTCPKCGGEGNVIEEPCLTCHGSGRVEVNKKIKVKIPAGVDTGTRVRISGEGEAGQRGSRAGDLYIFLHVTPDKNFKRRGDDILVEQTISFITAAMGGEIEVPTLEGKAKLKIPAGTQSETIFRMKNHGIKHLNASGRGDQNVKVTIDVPKKLNKKQKELLKQLDKSFNKKGWF